MNIPTPGSPEAQEQECTCPVFDNNYGKGIPGPDGKLFWKSANCPLHGWDEASRTPYKQQPLEERG